MARAARAIAVATACAVLGYVHWHESPGAVASTKPATICAPGYARSHRPPRWYAAAVKLVMAFPEAPARWQLDHRIPLCLGGAGWSLANLQLQPWDEARRKDAAEALACRLVCERRFPLAAEQWYFRVEDRW